MNKGTGTYLPGNCLHVSACTYRGLFPRTAALSKVSSYSTKCL